MIQKPYLDISKINYLLGNKKEKIPRKIKKEKASREDLDEKEINKEGGGKKIEKILTDQEKKELKKKKINEVFHNKKSKL